jgi:nucleoside-diphosphate-sugar epimerase
MSDGELLDMSRPNVVLGGEGMLGKALVRRLLQEGETVLSYDLKSGFDLRFQVPQHPEGNPYYWFLAWDVGGAKYIMDRSTQIQILAHNVQLCERVFCWLGDREAKFTFIGTQMSGFPNAYGLTKALGEYWARELGGNIARLWNIFDAEHSTARSHVIPDLVSQAGEGTIRLLTDGSERRQFLHADDCVDALLVQRRIDQRIADVSSGSWESVRSVADLIASETGAVVVPGDTPGYESLVDPVQLLPGWKPRLSLRAGLKRVVDVMLRGPNGAPQ